LNPFVLVVILSFFVEEIEFLDDLGGNPAFGD
jgi:hypothetical protein